MLGTCFINGEWLAVPCGVRGSETGKRSFHEGEEMVSGVGSLVEAFALSLIPSIHAVDQFWRLPKHFRFLF